MNLVKFGSHGLVGGCEIETPGSGPPRTVRFSSEGGG